MPGIEAFQRKQAAKQAQQSQGGSDGIKVDYFGIGDGQYAIVRFLEQGSDLIFADVHRIPVGRQYPIDLICLDTNDDGTPCPACASENAEIHKRASKGFLNLIWRDGPVYERNEWGSPKKDQNTKKPIITARQDGRFLWKCSSTVLQALVEKDSKYKGLMSRDFEIRRTGALYNNTKYSIDPADVDGGPQAMTIADQALAAEKYDLIELTKPLDFAAFVAAMSGQQQSGPAETMDRSALVSSDSVFSGGATVRASAFQRG